LIAEFENQRLEAYASIYGPPEITATHSKIEKKKAEGV